MHHPRLFLIRRCLLAAAIATAIFGLNACDQQRINELEDGVATEGDVRLKFGEPGYLNTTASLPAMSIT
jgi:hypothetical protein